MILDNHIKEGKENLNFGELFSASRKLERIVKQIKWMN
jgi:hypothetical protein